MGVGSSMSAKDGSTAAPARARRDLPHQERSSASDNQQFQVLRTLHIPGRVPLMTERCAGAASSEGRCKPHTPGPPVEAGRTFTTPPPWSAVQGPYKVEIIQLLQEFYDPSRPAWSLDEPKQILKDDMFPEAEPAIGGNMKGLLFTS